MASCGTISSFSLMSKSLSQRLAKTMRPTKVRASVGSKTSGSSRRPMRRFCARAVPVPGRWRGPRRAPAAMRGVRRGALSCGVPRSGSVGGEEGLQPGQALAAARARSRARRRQEACPGSGRRRGAPAWRRRRRPEEVPAFGRSPPHGGSACGSGRRQAGRCGLGRSPCGTAPRVPAPGTDGQQRAGVGMPRRRENRGPPALAPRCGRDTSRRRGRRCAAPRRGRG